MKFIKPSLTLRTGKSIVVKQCQICNSSNLKKILFLGYLPPVNLMRKIGEIPKEESSYPALLLLCKNCQLYQLGLIVDPQILFPPEYPYTSGTTRILRENFTDLKEECQKLFTLTKKDLIVDIGSNDGTLLTNFKNICKVQGVEPANVGKIAIKNGIPTIISYFNFSTVKKIKSEVGLAKIITATNVFAHMEDIHTIVNNILKILQPNGIFVTESHYVYDLFKTLQYDVIYHEHLRYYSLSSVSYLLEMHGLEIFHFRRIPTHGGSIRVYAARKGVYKVSSKVIKLLATEKNSHVTQQIYQRFVNRLMISKLKLHSLLLNLKKEGKKIVGISAPSRAATLINYVGLDENILDYIVEIKGSLKIGKYIPGTLIPVIEESKLYSSQPDYALIFSWHIAEGLMSTLKKRGYKGDFIIPLPDPHILEN